MFSSILLVGGGALIKNIDRVLEGRPVLLSDTTHLPC
jgi:actin-like ATPase involved in cell morphogenesis